MMFPCSRGSVGLLHPITFKEKAGFNPATFDFARFDNSFMFRINKNIYHGMCGFLKHVPVNYLCMLLTDVLTVLYFSDFSLVFNKSEILGVAQVSPRILRSSRFLLV